uniref:Uncharacterized protein n=1 Tax=Setaria italica TaxID=4555 RepID=K3ZP95_SETIT
MACAVVLLAWATRSSTSNNKQGHHSMAHYKRGPTRPSPNRKIC